MYNFLIILNKYFDGLVLGHLLIALTTFVHCLTQIERNCYNYKVILLNNNNNNNAACIKIIYIYIFFFYYYFLLFFFAVSCQTKMEFMRNCGSYVSLWQLHNDNNRNSIKHNKKTINIIGWKPT